MAYYRKVLQPGEAVHFVGRLHWIMYSHALIGLVVEVIIAGPGGGLVRANPDSPGLALAVKVAVTVCALYVLGSLIAAKIRRATTEIVVTDKRVLFKTGVVGRRTAEMNISKVETVDVLQGVLGRLLGFGTVLVRGTGSSLEPLVRVSSPIELRNAILAG